MIVWKRFERELAKIFNGTRHPVTGRGGEFPDIETSVFAIEAKTRKSVPLYLMRDTPLRFKGSKVLAIRLDTFLRLINGETSISDLNIKQSNRSIPDYVVSWLRQAKGFKKVPILIVHKDKTRIAKSIVIIEERFLKDAIRRGNDS